jgi:hypothetical protein
MDVELDDALGREAPLRNRTITMKSIGFSSGR